MHSIMCSIQPNDRTPRLELTSCVSVRVPHIVDGNSRTQKNCLRLGHLKQAHPLLYPADISIYLRIWNGHVASRNTQTFPLTVVTAQQSISAIRSTKAPAPETDKGFALAPSAKDLNPWYSDRNHEKNRELEDGRKYVAVKLHLQRGRTSV